MDCHNTATVFHPASGPKGSPPIAASRFVHNDRDAIVYTDTNPRRSRSQDVHFTLVAAFEEACLEARAATHWPHSSFSPRVVQGTMSALRDLSKLGGHRDQAAAAAVGKEDPHGGISLEEELSELILRERSTIQKLILFASSCSSLSSNSNPTVIAAAPIQKTGDEKVATALQCERRFGAQIASVLVPLKQALVNAHHCCWKKSNNEAPVTAVDRHPNPDMRSNPPTSEAAVTSFLMSLHYYEPGEEREQRESQQRFKSMELSGQPSMDAKRGNDGNTVSEKRRSRIFTEKGRDAQLSQEDLQGMHEKLSSIGRTSGPESCI